MEKNKLIESINQLYSDIDENITNLIRARLDHNQENEERCMFKMESLMVATQQELCCINDYLKGE